MKIALCVIATGKHDRFVLPLWESAQQYFLLDHAVTLFLFSDKQAPIECDFTAIDHLAWPGPTLYRYHSMLRARDRLLCFDYMFYIDADMRFVAPVRDEVLGSLTAVLHSGFCGRPRAEFTYERRPASRAFVDRDEGRHYFAGGFQGGRADCYLSAMETMRAAIDRDSGRGIVAV